MFLGIRRGQRSQRHDPLFVGGIQLRRDRVGESDQRGADVELVGELGPHVPGAIRTGGEGDGLGRAAFARGRERQH